MDREELYKEIYLQPDGDIDVCLEGMTWSQDKVNDNDVKYIRADIAEQKIKELEDKVIEQMEHHKDWIRITNEYARDNIKKNKRIKELENTLNDLLPDQDWKTHLKLIKKED